MDSDQKFQVNIIISVLVAVLIFFGMVLSHFSYEKHLETVLIINGIEPTQARVAFEDNQTAGYKLFSQYLALEARKVDQ